MAIGSDDLPSLTPASIQALTTAQLGALTTDELTGLGARVIYLTTSQIQGLSTDDLNTFTSAQFKLMTSTEVSAFTTAQVAALETDDLRALTTANFAALNTAQIQAITSDQFSALTSAQITALTTAQAHALTTDQVHALTTDQIHGLETQDIRAMTMTQLDALTSSAIGELTSAQFNAYFDVTPIVLDLDGHGINTLAAAQGVNFDLLGTGQTHKVGWVAGNDGLLVMDRNHDGIINNGSELFGMGTILANGKHAKDGFVAMAEQDSNHDGKLDLHDANFKDLRVWVDANHDGKTDAGELKTLEELGIASLDLHAAKGTGTDHGNLIGLVSSFTTTDGKNHDLADVWFAKDVKPQTAHDDKTSLALNDVLAPASNPLLGAEHVDLAKTALLPELPDVHLASVDRKLAEEDEHRRNLGGQWI